MLFDEKVEFEIFELPPIPIALPLYVPLFSTKLQLDIIEVPVDWIAPPSPNPSDKFEIKTHLVILEVPLDTYIAPPNP